MRFLLLLLFPILLCSEPLKERPLQKSFRPQSFAFSAKNSSLSSTSSLGAGLQKQRIFYQENFKICARKHLCSDLKVAVIGSGPSGLSSALVTARDRIPTTVFCGQFPGGPLNARTCCGNWPGSLPGKGNIVMERLHTQTKKLGVNFVNEELVKVDFSRRPFRLETESGLEYFAECVIIANGARQTQLSLESEAAYLGRGIEAYLYKTDIESLSGKKVVIVGGGLDASKKASIAAKGASEVTLVVRGRSMQRPFMEERLKATRVLYQSNIVALSGGERLTHVVIQTPDGAETVEADLLIHALGITPNTELYSGQVPMDERGLILLEGRTQKTLVPGVFAAGTVCDGTYRQAAISAGDGMKAGYDALNFLRSKSDSLAQLHD